MRYFPHVAVIVGGCCPLPRSVPDRRPSPVSRRLTTLLSATVLASALVLGLVLGLPRRRPAHPPKAQPRLPNSRALAALQRLLVPSIMPLGLDPYQLLSERDRFVEARIQQRINELMAMPATMGDGDLEPVVRSAIDKDEAARLAAAGS